MITFLKPTKLKLNIVLGLIVYSVISVVILSSFNSTRSLGTKEFGPIHTALGVVAYPAIYLGIPMSYVVENFFTEKINLSDFMNETGCLDCDSEEFNQTIERSTPLGLLVGLVVEVLFLYLISCLIAFLLNFRKKGYLS